MDNSNEGAGGIGRPMPRLRCGRVFEGDLVGTGLRIGIVVGRLNQFITERLLEGAVDGLRRHGVDPRDIDVAWVPGGFEIPLAAKRMAQSGRYDAVCCLGAVIRGATPHFDHVAGQAARGVAQASWDTDVPVIFGVLTTDTIEQAVERAGTKAGNKGYEAAVTAIEMAQLLKTLAHDIGSCGRPDGDAQEKVAPARHGSGSSVGGDGGRQTLSGDGVQQVGGPRRVK